MNTTVSPRYNGENSPLFWLYFKTACLTVITLGIYRFWAKTRMRKYIWSSIRADNDALEYTGTGLEKFLGFLVAIVILAIYLGLVQMLLFFVGMNLFSQPTTQNEALAQIAAIYITLLATVPLFLFAIYRSRRYRLARTRWRGIRFGMDQGAWGYAWRAILHYLLSIITFGIMLPRQTFYLEKYMADRSWYGDAKFDQNGKWTALYAGLKHVLIGLAILIVCVAGGAALESPVLMIVGIIIGYVWLIVGGVFYRVYAFNYLTRQKKLDGQVAFRGEARTGKVIGIVLVGGIVLGVAAAVLFGLLGAAMSGVVMSMSLNPAAINPAVLILPALVYVAILLALGGLALILITQPLINHFVGAITIENADHLNTIRQRAADKGADAEGFAEALDIGGAI